MTVSSDLARVQYTGNGTSKVFSTGFAFLSNLDVKVILTENATGVETVWVENAQYTLSGAGTEVSGTLVAMTAPAIGFTLTIMRNVQFIQDLDGNTLSTMDAGDQEVAYDKIWHALSQLKEGLRHTVHASDGAIVDVPGTWIPILGIVADGATRQVVQVTGWTGGEGNAPDAGMYVGPIGYVTDIHAASNIKGNTGPQGIQGIPGNTGATGPQGPQGATGLPGPAGTGAGDMLRASNLSDVLDKPASRTNLGLGTAATKDVGAAAGQVPDAATVLPLTGGTLTGDLTITKTQPGLVLNKTSVNNHPIIHGALNGVDRWMMSLGDNNPESGGDTGAYFTLFSMTDAGAVKDICLSGRRDTGLFSVKGVPTAPLGIATKGYVDGMVPIASYAEYVANTGAGASKLLTPTQVWWALNQITLSGANVTPDFAVGIDFAWDLTANSTINSPLNATKPGQKGCISLHQTGAGGFTVTWGPNFKFPGGIKPTLSTASGSFDVVSYWVVNSTLIFCTFNAGFA